jgi:hypothetical protein
MILRAALATFLCLAAIGCNSDDGATSSDVTSVSVAVTETGTVPRAESSTTPAPPPTDVVDVESVPSGPDVEGVTTDPETGDGADVGELVDARIAVPSGDIELGETDAFVVTANGSLFWHPGLLSGEPQEAIPIAIVDEGNQVGRVAGVVDGSVIFGSCCSPATGQVAAATGSPGPSTRLTEGAAPTLSPDGAHLAIVSDTALSIFDVATGDGASRSVGGDETGTLVPSDIIWLDGDGPVALVMIDGEYALAAVDPVAVTFGTPVPIGVPQTSSTHVELAGAGPNGEIAVATSTGTEVRLRVFEVDTLDEDESLTRPLPDGVRSVRVTRDGELLWVDGDTLWHTPAGESVPVPLGAGSAAAWFASPG